MSTTQCLNPLCVEGLRIGAPSVKDLRGGGLRGALVAPSGVLAAPLCVDGHAGGLRGVLAAPLGNRPVVSVSNISTYILWF